MTKFGKERAESLICTYRKVYEMVYRAAYTVKGIVLDAIEMPATVRKELIIEFPSEWAYEGVYEEPF